MVFHFPPHLTHSSALPGKQTSTKIACPQPDGGRVRRVPPQPEPRPTMIAIIRMRKGSHIVLHCCIERVSRVYCICSARITREDGGMSPQLQLCVTPTVCVPGIPRGGQYFVPGTAGAHVTPTSSSKYTSHVTHVMLTDQIDRILIIGSFTAVH